MIPTNEYSMISEDIPLQGTFIRKKTTKLYSLNDLPAQFLESPI